MTIYVLVSEPSPIRLWGLNPTQRLQRQLDVLRKESPEADADIQWKENASELPDSGRVMILNGSFLFENRTLRNLIDHFPAVLRHTDNTIAAVFANIEDLNRSVPEMGSPDECCADTFEYIQTSDMEAFDENLRRARTPLLEPVSAERKKELEDRLYGNAYRGITDLVTKFIWPRPAKQVVRLCASLQISPNMVTSLGLLLVVASCYLFRDGYYGWGLAAGWIMTFLDTVDGKLARVTIQSSKFGHLFDHAIDLIHPPFWYIFWGMSLVDFQPVGNLGLESMYWIIVIAYIAGRCVEGIFPLLGSCSIFTWQPFDAWFRLVTARRNPCLILLSVGFLAGKPEWGFLAVTLWSALTTIVLVIRFLQALVVRVTNGPLISWLTDDKVESGPNALSYTIFGTTRGAYARQK